MPIAPPKASAIFTRFVEPRKHEPGVTAPDQHGQVVTYILSHRSFGLALAELVQLYVCNGVARKRTVYLRPLDVYERSQAPKELKIHVRAMQFPR